MRVLPLAIASVFTIMFSGSVLAQDACPFGYGSDKAFDALAKALSGAKSCGEAVKTMDECEWGSSADTQFAAIVVGKCEKSFFPGLSEAAKANYEEEMQLCAYRYAKAEGTLAMSEAALCQVYVAAKIAANPSVAAAPVPRASFDCAKAKSPLEKAICSDTRLGHADIVLGRVYGETLKQLKEKQATDLVDSEKKWLAQVAQNCHAGAGPLNLAERNCVAVEFENRFTDLDGCAELEAAEGQSVAECLAESAASREQEVNGESEDRNRASFDCEKPKNALELAICADASLGQEEIKVANTYQESLRALDLAERLKLVESEKKWLDYVQRV